MILIHNISNFVILRFVFVIFIPLLCVNFRNVMVEAENGSTLQPRSQCGISSWFSWRPTSDGLLEAAEKQILRCM